MNRRIVILGGAVAAVIAIAIAVVAWLAGRGDAPPAQAPAPAAAATAAPEAEGSAEAAPTRFDVDDDPAGSLRLEGQVLDDSDDPVGGAVVWLSSVPPRQTTTEDDGSFSFDALVGRRYALRARAGDRIAGPHGHHLTATSEPVILRLRQGGVLTVEVVGDGDAPVAGATATLLGPDARTAKTDGKGVAVLRGVDGWVELVVTADGYAPGRATGTVDGRRTMRVALRRGAAVAGRVTDAAGAPVDGARVVASDVGQPGLEPDAEREGVRTGADGRFELPAIAAGTYRFSAVHGEHAPGTTAPITVDGATPRRDVEIVLAAGATLAGTVVDAARAPVPYATVRIAPKDASMWSRGAGRQVTADASGAFAVSGLARAALRVRAESEQAASAIVDVDLTAVAEKKDLTLVLDVTGTIAGVVVDGSGAPLGEVEVKAMADVLAGARAEDMGFTGFASATTDGDGRFALRGLADGPYRVRAQRAGGRQRTWGGEGTPARPGTLDLRLVLPAPGGIRGTIAFAGGGAPERASVTIGWAEATAADGGRFVIEDVEPGSHDLKVRGPDFAELTRPGVTVAAGQVTDVGVLTVTRGRRITGTVTDASGAPVSGAKVSVGKTILTSSNGSALPGIDDDVMGVRSATSGPDGGFVIAGASSAAASLVADHPTRGRSMTAQVPAGDADPPPVRLGLAPFGSLEGIVTAGGRPVAQAMVQATQGGSGHVTIATAGADGRFVFDRLPAGELHITAMQVDGMGTLSGTSQAVVVAGQRAQIVVDIPVGDVTLTVEVKARPGATVNAAQVFVARGVLSVKTGKELNALAGSGGNNGMRMAFWFGGAAPTFEKLAPGPISICSIPITGSMSDPTFTQRLQENVDVLEVHCMPHTVAPGPAKQSLVQELPSMTPLPAPKAG
jgi:protocatechuate 3,4-dioxygenase beta subunit